MNQTSLYLKPGDMIVFEETGEVCVLIEKFDVWAENAEDKEGQGRFHWPTWAWRGLWHPYGADDDRGPWQRKLEPGCTEDTKKYGMSSVNLFNGLSHARARRKGGVVTVPPGPERKMKKEIDL